MEIQKKSAVEDTDISFKNFDKNIILRRDGDYYRTKNGLSIKLNHQLVVKTKKSVSLRILISMSDQVVDGKEVFVAREFNYYLVTLTKVSDIGKAIDRLMSSPGVLLVQPDILQVGFQQVLNKQSINDGAQGSTNQKITPSELNVIGSAVFAHKSSSHHGNALSEEEKSIRFSRWYNSYLKKLGVPSLWEKSQGEGVRIAIIDDGIQLQHPALHHVKKGFIYDVDSHTASLYAMAKGAEHGTKVAGVIFANGRDSEPHRIRGLAPKATLIALRNPSTLTSSTLLSFHMSMLANADIINCSWNSHWLLQPIADAVNELAMNGRDGKGTAVIFAAGNDGKLLQEQGVEASIDKALVVAAVNSRGVRLVKSNYGESVDLLVYGRKIHSTASNDEYQHFAGTSLAAAITSGLAALTLATQNDLSLKQLQTQLATLTHF